MTFHCVINNTLGYKYSILLSKTHLKRSATSLILYEQVLAFTYTHSCKCTKVNSCKLWKLTTSYSVMKYNYSTIKPNST
jgi:hypothetical protein